MSKQVAVILSGCGVQDGSEIYETTLTLLRLDQLGIGYRCFAPDIDQSDVIDHRSGEAVEERRSVLVESARLARGEISPLAELEADEFDAVILPGGFGAAKNLSNFAEAGADMVIHEGLVDVLGEFHEDRKPIGLMCIAPVMVPRLLGPGIAVTIGHDPGVAGAISSMGGLHRSCGVEDIVVDFEHRVVTTPAYMIATRLGEAATGIFKLVDRIDELMDL
ncbi:MULTISPECIES: isoprenoid biosynthesis glyoxalase ElbB [Halomonas]|uniref:Glyoxalase n=2 Tax=Halomonas TaxID=2745 RepID=A0ABQ0U2Q6_9GAMM|nr:MULTISPECIES: isoprenoid biosynthesis glyoxalase ElbB [Halomonas]PSJ22956.1 isoprenoid biosynthesis protein ElbB [Halomonas sp. ND22Bw]KGE79440.1 isoprenoid biosynthesis protein [Halomonas salina]MDR5890037.1 isoprenoid biosynthesis glyoxalase ElbB [Halomonas salina]RAH39273.1 isoprenoid biosynthesis protein ElbB [Halomonas sp. SL1]WJY06859.1 isoprenoid biosynthesis glyoxalase ElbB [Halomonas halophila]